VEPGRRPALLATRRHRLLSEKPRHRRIAVEDLALPARQRRLRRDREAAGRVTAHEVADRIGAEPRHLPNGRNEPAIGPPDARRARGVAYDPVAALVEPGVARGADPRAVLERRRATLGPVLEAVRLEPEAALAAMPDADLPVPRRERPAQRRGEHATLPARLDTPVRVVPHLDDIAIASEAPHGLGRERRAVLEVTAAVDRGVREHLGVDVHDHLVALGRAGRRRAGERARRDADERIRPALWPHGVGSRRP
jgi:hypothetical protein